MSVVILNFQCQCGLNNSTGSIFLQLSTNEFYLWIILFLANVLDVNSLMNMNAFGKSRK